MSSIDPETVLKQLQWRYAVKKFDPTLKIPNDSWHALEQSMVLAPSSFGLQPWKFIVVTNPAIKEKLPAISWNQDQPRDCSHMVVFAVLRELTEAHVDRFVDRITEIRGVDRESLNGYRNVMVSSVNKSVGSHQEWNTRQAYLALGQLMTAAAMLGIDTCPMEGIELGEYDRLLGLEGQPYATVVACAVGYRATDDKYASAAKVRFDRNDVVHDCSHESSSDD